MPPTEKALVWDAPQRVGHALLLLCFAGAWVTGENGSARLWHLSFGVAAAGLVVWRVVWGLVGSRYARFTGFVRSPTAALAHLRALVLGHAEPSVGHNPAGAWAVVALLAMGLGVPASGWLALGGPHAVEEAHEVLAHAWLLLVGLHVGAVLLTGWLQRENLVRAMVTGHKRAPADAGLSSARHGWALLPLVGCLGFAAWQVSQAPAGEAVGQARVQAWAAHEAERERSRHHGEDDD